MNPLKTKVSNICQVRITPQATCYIIEVVYEKTIKEGENDLNLNAYLAIDLGINNLATCTNNVGLRPFIVNGRIIKSFNQYYNKEKSKLQSFVGDKSSRRIEELTLKRNNKVADYMHKTSRIIINYCLKHKIKTIIVGKNKNWKQEINIGKKNNQNFTTIPFNKLIEQLMYKGEEVEIIVIIQEESYTSKCSALDFEEIKKKEVYLGKRTNRGMFITSSNKRINADVNGSLNIMRKVIGNDFLSNRGLVLSPYRISAC